MKVSEMEATGKVPVPLLYRHILKALKQFPSIRRETLTNEVKSEFHANKTLRNEGQIKERLRAAINGLEQLAQYAGMEHTADEWALYLRGGCE